ncbi:hypothetical protein CONPUDRAFT_35478, partial [Coniophora puteana RWD-64-598 SS2]
PPVHRGPLSFSPLPLAPIEFLEDDRLHVRTSQNPALAVIQRAAPAAHAARTGALLQTSLTGLRRGVYDVLPRAHGLVGAVIEAHAHARGLVVRPDDVWLAILLQWAAFVRARPGVVDFGFGGIQWDEPVVEAMAWERYVTDAKALAERLEAHVEQRIPDTALRAWAQPRFSTTTDDDRPLAADNGFGASVLGLSLSAGGLGAGIPRVTLEGTRADWESLKARGERLRGWGVHGAAWRHLLAPVLARLVSAWDNPHAPANRAFWRRVVRADAGALGLAPPMGMGGRTASGGGWITAFCAFDVAGRW